MFPNEVPASRGDMITELLSWRERATKARWITDTLPDDEMTVLMRLNDNEYPVWPGFRDDGEWRSCDGTTVAGPVLGWMQLEDAASALDGRVPPNVPDELPPPRNGGLRPCQHALENPAAGGG